MKKKALITGITGQDGSYLAEFLVSKGYEVFGLVRRSSSTASSLQRIDSLLKTNQIRLLEGDLLDSLSMRRALEIANPHEVYNLAAMSDVAASFQMAEYTSNINALGVLKFLEAICEINPSIRFYQASTSELFGKAKEFPQNESTPFHPRSPYGLAKLYAFWMTVHFKEAHGLFACNGILFNHESPRRGERFVSRKISLGVASIALGLKDKISLGNLNAKRDWGYAKDFVEGMWMMLQLEKPEDFVLATGKARSVKDFVQKAFREIEIDLVWKGEGIDEKGMDAASGKVLVDVDSEYFRPSEVDHLMGDPCKAKSQMGWESKTSFEELVSLMVQSDLKLLSNNRELCFS